MQRLAFRRQLPLMLRSHSLLHRKADRLNSQQLSRYSTFDNWTYTPDDRLSSRNIQPLLQKSILAECSADEIKSRIELAACYRLFELAGWNDCTHNHLSAKVTEDDGRESYLINAYGLKYSEITASSLIKVSIDGEIIHHGSTGDTFGLNLPGFIIHSAIHRARSDAKSVMHCHERSGTAVASINQGLIKMGQASCKLGPIAHHDYEGIVVDIREQESLVKSLGNKRIMLLCGHGVLTAAESVPAAWYLMHQLLEATSIQTQASACALENEANIYTPAPAARQRTSIVGMKRQSKSNFGVTEFCAYMRWLDKIDPSYRV